MSAIVLRADKFVFIVLDHLSTFALCARAGAGVNAAGQTTGNTFRVNLSEFV